MTLPLTPEMLAAAYDFLRTTPPFTGWRLPESDDVVFGLSLRPKEFGRYQWDGEHHTITMSIKAIAHTDTLMRYMAHEMVHLSLEKDGLEEDRRRRGSQRRVQKARRSSLQVPRLGSKGFLLMSRPLIAIVGLIYVLVSIDSGIKGNVGLSIMYAAYALANVGLWMIV